MKCKTCKIKMINILKDFEQNYNGKIKKAVNVPACQCPQCNNVVITSLVMSSLKGYAIKEKSNIIDFAKHKKQEEDEYIVLHMLGMM